MKYSKNALYIFLIVMIFITCLASSGNAMKQFADTIADREEKQASSSIN